MPVRKSPKVTIKEIAKICNVSTQTVSRVINKRAEVSPETRATIEAAIAELGYRPSAVARSLVNQYSSTLGVITAGLQYLGIAQTINGITEACEAGGYTLILKELPRFDTPDIVPIFEALMEHQVEGIIFAAPDLNENIRIAQSQLPPYSPPIIFLKCEPNPNFTTISIDNYGGARQAVEYFLSLRRMHIGFIAGPLEWLEARQRKQGWEDALRSAGIDSADYKWSQGNWSSASGEAAFAELYQRYSRMNAVFISNDQMALGALHYAHSHGIRVPEDIAIIGFDNLAEGAYFTPSLTTITHPLRELGNQAVKMLLEKIDNPMFVDRKITLETELLIRDSTPRG